MSSTGESSGFSADVDSVFDSMDTGGDDIALDTASDIPADTGDAPLEEEQPGVEGEQPPVETAPPAEPLEEGVRLVERDGKKEYRVRETQFNGFREAANLRRELEQRLVPDSIDGKPVSVDDIRSALKLREATYLGNQDMHLDFKSGDHGSHQKFIDHWMDQGQEALKDGAPADPFTGFAATLFDAVAERHPDAYAQIQSRASRKLLDDVYEVAAGEMSSFSAVLANPTAYPPEQVRAAEGSRSLYYAAQHLEKLLFSKYRKVDGSEVVVQRQAQARRAAQQPQNGHRQQQQQPARPDAQAQAWTNYRTTLDTNSKSAIRREVDSSLADVKQAYEKAGDPGAGEAVLDRLNSQIHKELKDDAEWQRQILIELRNARISGSEQRRQELGELIARRHATRAKQIIARSIGPIRAAASKALRVNLEAAHGRRAAVQDKRAPAGGGPPPRVSLIPTRDSGEWNPRDARGSFNKEIDRLLG